MKGMEVIRIAWRVSANCRSFLELTFVMALAFVNRRKNRIRRFFLSDLASVVLKSARGTPFEVKLRDGGNTFSVVFPGTPETEFWSISSIITEVLVRRVYDVSPDRDIRIVVDAGANVGLATLFLRLKFPLAEFICYEPSKSTYQLLVRNLTLNNVRFRAFRKALSDSDCIGMLETGRSSMERRLVELEGLVPTEPVECVRLDSECLRLGISRIDLLKFDVEGSEVRLLRGLGEQLRSVEAVVGETHDPASESEVRRLLEESGFEVAQARGHTVAHRRQLTPARA